MSSHTDRPHSNDLQIEAITLDNPHYQAERELRNRVLLRPIGLPDHAWEQKDPDCVHLVAVNPKVVGCVLLWPNGLEGQLLQMAVEPNLQGQGVGRLLVEALLKAARERELQNIFCHSRYQVRQFYARLGFREVGPIFQEVGLDHVRMELSLHELPAFSDEPLGL